jgi:hypothetical protein
VDRAAQYELIPLCAAAAIAWGHAIDYPSLRMDGAQFEQQMQRMEALLRCLIPVYGENPPKVRKADLYRAIKGLRSGPPQPDWWAVPQKQRPAMPSIQVRLHRAPELSHAA